MARIAWSRRAADELWSGVVSPLTFSLLSDVMADRMVRRRLRGAGFREASEAPVFRRIRGRVYVNATLIAQVLEEVPAVFLSDGLLSLLPDELKRAVLANPRRLGDLRTLRTIAALFRNEERWTPWSRSALFRDACARVALEHAGPTGIVVRGPEEIVQAFETTQEKLGEYLEVVSWVMIYAYVFFHLAAHVSESWFDEDGTAWMARGVSGVRTFEVHGELEALAGELRCDEALRATVSEPPPEEVVAAARRGELGSFGEALLDLCQRHGHRMVSRDLVHPTWAERPESVVEMVRRLAVTPSLAGGREERSERARVPAGVRGFVLHAGLSWCREYYAARENMRYHADYYMADLRQLSLVAAADLLERGVLRERDDVFHLTLDELRSALLGETGDLGQRAARRRQEARGYADEVLPEVVWGDDTPAPQGAQDAPEPSGGQSASPGVAEGAARVVRSVAELEAICPGEVLVAPATDPTWTSYLSLASAVVLEVGGLLSHGAIVARELGIPAVVGVAGATTRFRTGERLRVDGAAGVVERCGGE